MVLVVSDIIDKGNRSVGSGLRMWMLGVIFYLFRFRRIIPTVTHELRRLLVYIPKVISCCRIGEDKIHMTRRNTRGYTKALRSLISCLERLSAWSNLAIVFAVTGYISEAGNAVDIDKGWRLGAVVGEWLRRKSVRVWSLSRDKCLYDLKILVPTCSFC